MKNRASILFIFILGLFINQSVAQLISANPVFPTADNSVTLIFQSNLGSGGLEGYNGDVYAHIGLITENSTSPSDWKYTKTNWGENTPETKMTRTGGSQYQLHLTPDIRSYFGVPMDEEIEQIALVFRSENPEDGRYLEGKTAEGGDIFVSVFAANSGLHISRSEPSTDILLVEEGSTIPIHLDISQPSNVQVFDNNVEIFQDTEANVYDGQLIAESGVAHVIKILIESDGQTAESQFTYLALREAEQENVPDEVELGLHIIDDGHARITLEAPNKESVLLFSNLNNWLLDDAYWMKQSLDGRYFWIDVDISSLSLPFLYQFIVDGDIVIADPLSEAVLDSRNDAEVSSSVFPDLPDFPSEAIGSLVSMYDDFDYNWQVDNFERPPKNNLIVYEVLMRDAFDSHHYVDLIDSISYYKKLGINAIELMPINEFEGNDSWGYNPSFHGAVDKYYGTPQQFKEFVDKCHEEGIAVIVDVVFNHVFSQSPLAQLYWDSENFRPAPNNPWLNVEAKHPFNVGYDVNHEYSGTQDWMDQILKRWINTYKIDGFRFDLSKGFTQVDNPNNVSAWGRYDASRIALLKRLADEIWAIDDSNYVILEHLSDNQEEKELAEYGMLLWGNMNHNYGEASMGFTQSGRSDLAGGLASERGWEVNNLVTYMESHDEERQMYRNLNFGNSSGGYSTREMSTGIDRLELISTFFYTLPGSKMLWQFGEMAYPYSINRCTDGTIDNECRLSRKPIEWSLLEVNDRMDLFNVTRDLIHLKTNYSTFNSDNISYSLRDETKWIVSDVDDLDAVVVGNFDVVDQSISVSFTKIGKWYEYFSGDSITINNVDQSINLQAGEYKMYLDQKLVRFSDLTIVSTSDPLDNISDAEISIYPNPVRSQLTIDLSQIDAVANRVTLTDVNGSMVDGQLVHVWTDRIFTYSLSDRLGDGIYFIQIVTDQGIISRKIIIQRN